MVTQAVSNAKHLMDNVALPMSDDNFSPQNARSIILAYQGALSALVEEVVNAQAVPANTVEMDPDAPSAPTTEDALHHMFSHFGKQTIDVVEAGGSSQAGGGRYELWAVVETTRRAVAILPDREHALHVASMFDIV